jgi:AAA-like domain/LAGLIDADG-like domain
MIRELAGNLTLTRADVTAWYRLAPVQWAYRSDASREELLDSVTAAYAALPGRSLHLRITERPYPAGQWASTLTGYVHGGDARTPGLTPVNADVFAARVRAAAGHLGTRAMAETETYLGVTVAGRRVVDRLTGRHADREASRLAATLRGVDDIVAGLDGYPAAEADVEWLLHRSAGLGLPDPRHLPGGGPVADTDTAAYGDNVTTTPGPWGSQSLTVTGHAHRYGADTTRQVAVVSLGRMEALDIPGEHEPWLVLAQRLPFPVEWSVRGSVVAGPDAQRAIARKLDLVADQRRQYAAHGLEEPPELDRVAERAREIRDDMQHGTADAATRVMCWVRGAVSASSTEQLEERVRALTALYRDVHVAVERPRAQVAVAAEFTPGAPRTVAAHRRVLPARYFAAALPQATSRIGDQRGWYRGYTCGTTRRPVVWDPWWGMLVREGSGLTPIIGKPGAGKALALDTPLPTPTGWTTMGAVGVGDALVGSDGRPTIVVAATDVMLGRPCFEVEFSDGGKIVADADHQWVTRDTNGRQRADKHRRASSAHTTRSRRDGPGLCACGCGSPAGIRAGHVRTGEPRDYILGHTRAGITPTTSGAERVRTTAEIAATLSRPDGGANHAIRTTEPFDLPAADLLLDPYVLGAWLGDGTSRGNGFTCFDAEIITEIESRGYVARPLAGPGHYGLGLPTSRRGGFRGALRTLGVLRDKRIPVVYLRGSEQQRRDLLAGLLDTDGHCSKAGAVELSITNERLARDARELILSLGYKATLRAKPCRGRHEHTSVVYTVAFRTADKVFRLTRKLARQDTAERSSRRWRRIVGVRPVPSVPVRCVQVDNADHMYLAGRSMIPTHNSVLMGSIAYDAALAGVHTTILDPSGPLARLTTMPEFACRARHIDLLGARPGTLSPYAIIGTPMRRAFHDDPAVLALPASERDGKVAELYTEACAVAAADRRMLAGDVIRMLLPAAVLRRPETDLLVAAAVRQAGSTTSTTLLDVVACLDRADDPMGATLAEYLRDINELPLARLLFPSGASVDAAVVGRSRPEDVLLVLTMAGLVLPDPDTDRDTWPVQERLAVPLLHLAAHYATRRVYGQRMNVRKLTCIDEAHFIAGWPSGRALFARQARDSRKWLHRVLASTQMASDVLGQNVAGLVEEAFVGRLEDYPDARAALDLIGVPTDVGYEATVQRLSPRVPGTGRADYREFLFRDVDGHIDKIRVDLSHNPELLAVLDPGSDRALAVAG